MEELSKQQESLLQSLRSRHGRKKHELCLCEGVRSCRELISSSPELVEFAVCSADFEAAKWPLSFLKVPPARFAKLSATIESQGIILVTRRPCTVWRDIPPEDPFALVLDRISDPGNMGTILRTARAIGLRDIWLTECSADPFSDKVIRAATGAHFALRIRECGPLPELAAELRSHGIERFYRTNPHEGVTCFSEKSLFERSAIILGSEGHGAAELPGSIPLTIPMPGDAESLNVAQAATIILFEHVRRQQT
ncbi:MAG: hypothetical protein A2X49_03095 [Lentisphaerae bacterium GWF2_52_8]|nr:MAG: hypothetical protein A2X49_03095 [Lentisphaerae bacterium GWF2_52_8]